MNALSFQTLRGVHAHVLAAYEHARKQEIGIIEQKFPGELGVSLKQLYGIEGEKRHEGLLHAAVWALHHRAHIRMPKEHIALYLNLTEQEVEHYLASAETALVSSAGNPTRENMLACFQYFGPTIARVLAMVG